MNGFLAEHGGKTILGLAVGVLSFFVKKIYTKVEREYEWRANETAAEREEQRLIKAGLLAMLHDKVYTVSQAILSDGTVTVSDLENLRHVYNSYVALGGNGTAKALYERVQSLPIGTGEL